MNITREDIPGPTILQWTLKMNKDDVERFFNEAAQLKPDEFPEIRRLYTMLYNLRP